MRFTDTTKWDRENFRKLSLKAKVAWDYITTRCDSNGMWHPDFGTMSHFIGAKITREQFLRELGHKIRILPNGVWFIPSFIRFQYGEKLRPDCNAHRPVIRRLRELGIDPNNPSGTVPEQSLGTVLDKDKDKDKDQDKDKDKESSTDAERHATESPETPDGAADPEAQDKPALDFEPVYRAYPLKRGKAKGLEALRKKIRDPTELEAVLRGVHAYAAECIREKRERKYIAHFSTFVNQERWKDYAGEDDSSSMPENRQYTFD